MLGGQGESVALPSPASAPTPVGSPPLPKGRPDARGRAGKRTFDVATAVFGLVVGAPLLLAILVAVRLTSRGPALYSQMRIGQHGRPFRCWKFRTMAFDADLRLPAMLQASATLRREYEESCKLSQDSRITRIGRLLRHSGLDELPQLWNVLCGSMSVVGPRPMLPHERDGYGDAFPVVVAVRPGLTGIWQVSGRNAVPYATRIDMQVQQARQTAFHRDLLIVLRTAVQIVRWRSNGAH